MLSRFLKLRWILNLNLKENISRKKLSGADMIYSRSEMRGEWGYEGMDVNMRANISGLVSKKTDCYILGFFHGVYRV